MSELLDLLATSRRNVDALADPESLRHVAEEIGDLVGSRGITELIAASPAAERIVGAALLLATQHARRAVAAGHVDDRVALVVDVNFASGTAMAEAARRARQDGAREVQGLVLHRLDEAVGPQECGLDRLEVLGRNSSSPTQRP